MGKKEKDRFDVDGRLIYGNNQSLMVRGLVDIFNGSAARTEVIGSGDSVKEEVHYFKSVEDRSGFKKKPFELTTKWTINRYRMTDKHLSALKRNQELNLSEMAKISSAKLQSLPLVLQCDMPNHVRRGRDKCGKYYRVMKLTDRSTTFTIRMAFNIIKTKLEEDSNFFSNAFLLNARAIVTGNYNWTPDLRKDFGYTNFFNRLLEERRMR